MDSSLLSRQSTVEITTNTSTPSQDGFGASTVDLPTPIQKSLDAILDYYVETAQKPEIKLCGQPLDIASDLVIQFRETVPAHLTNAAKDVLDFLIRELAEFCKLRAINHLTVRFAFDKSYRAEAV